MGLYAPSIILYFLIYIIYMTIDEKGSDQMGEIYIPDTSSSEVFCG